MEKIYFKNVLPLSQRDLPDADNINFAYHVLNHDFPLLHTHGNYWEFTLLTEGSIVNVMNGKPQIYTKGTLFFLTDEDYHYIQKKGSGSISFTNIIVKKDFLVKYLDVISPTFYDTLKNGQKHYVFPDSLTFFIESIIHKVNLLAHESLLMQNDLLFSAWMLIIQWLYSANIHQAPASKKRWQEKLDALLSQSQFLTMTTDDLCKELNYSKAQLFRIFKNHFNTTPHEYLQTHKFRYAQNLLSFSDTKIIDIAAKVGFKNLSQFNVIFKRKFGMTPSQYRKINKQ